MATLGTDERKEPPENAAPVRNAIARFNHVKGVSDTDRDAAWKRIKAAAKKYDGSEREELSEDWQGLGVGVGFRPTASSGSLRASFSIADVR